MSVLYSPSKPADKIRAALEAKAYDAVPYWTGTVLCVAVSSSVSKKIPTDFAIKHFRNSDMLALFLFATPAQKILFSVAGTSSYFLN